MNAVDFDERDDPVDPGWRPAWKYLVFFICPLPPLIYWAARRWGESRLVALRGMHLNFFVMLVNLGPAIFPIERSAPSGTSGSRVAAFIAVALVPLLAELFWRRSMPLPCADGPQLVASFTVLHLLELSLSIAPCLFGFVATFVFQELWPYFVGLVVSVVGLLLSAPTRRAIGRRQRQLEAKGCDASLRRALADHSAPLIGG